MTKPQIKWESTRILGSSERALWVQALAVEPETLHPLTAHKVD